MQEKKSFHSKITRNRFLRLRNKTFCLKMTLSVNIMSKTSAEILRKLLLKEQKA